VGVQWVSDTGTTSEKSQPRLPLIVSVRAPIHSPWGKISPASLIVSVRAPIHSQLLEPDFVHFPLRLNRHASGNLQSHARARTLSLTL